MAEVESFSLDHTKVQAPYVRKIETQQGPAGGQIVNYDLRLTQPNLPSLLTLKISLSVLLSGKSIDKKPDK